VKRRGATGLVGIIPIDKPAGMTSHDVVAAVRRATGEGRVGHAGTLDPMATGLLVVLVGAYTRLAPYLTSASKSYDATISFGTETDTDDAEGVPVRTAPVPPEVLDAEYARTVLGGLLGHSSQMPPAYSAIKVAGRTAHSAARAGEPIELEPRDIEVTRADLVSVDAEALSWRVSFTVSKGTYIRALARDIGRACGSAAHLSALRRTSSGALSLMGANTLENVVAAAADGHLESLFAEPIAALGLPVVESLSAALRVGAAFAPPSGLVLPEGDPVSITCDGRLAAIYRVAAGRLVPLVVLPGGVAA
jgi:tRNA pseudouridine55 synthase